MSPPPVKISVPYEHDSSDLSTVYLAVTTRARPTETEWRPAYRDIDRAGKKPAKVVFALFRSLGGQLVKVWIRDRDGDRPVRTERL